MTSYCPWVFRFEQNNRDWGPPHNDTWSPTSVAPATLAPVHHALLGCPQGRFTCPDQRHHPFTAGDHTVNCLVIALYINRYTKKELTDANRPIERL